MWLNINLKQFLLRRSYASLPSNVRGCVCDQIRHQLIYIKTSGMAGYTLSLNCISVFGQSTKKNEGCLIPGIATLQQQLLQCTKGGWSVEYWCQPDIDYEDWVIVGLSPCVCVPHFKLAFYLPFEQFPNHWGMPRPRDSNTESTPHLSLHQRRGIDGILTLVQKWSQRLCSFCSLSMCMHMCTLL